MHDTSRRKQSSSAHCRNKLCQVLLLYLVTTTWATSSGYSGHNDAVTTSAEVEKFVGIPLHECFGASSSFRRSRSQSITVEPELSYSGEQLIFSVEKNENSLLCDESRNLARLNSPFNHGGNMDILITFLPSGHLQVFANNTEFANVYDPTEYCFLRNSKGISEIQFCTANNCESQSQGEKTQNPAICIRKCCPPGYAFDYIAKEHGRDACQPSGGMDWKPNFYHAHSISSTCISPVAGQTEDSHGPAYRISTPGRSDSWCQGNFLYLPLISVEIEDETNRSYAPIQGYPWRLLDDGTVIEEQARNPLSLGGRWIRTEYFCVDGLQNIGLGEKYAGPSFPRHQVLVICSPPYENSQLLNGTEEDVPAETPDDIQNIVQITHMIIFFLTLPFFGLTLVAYYLDWKSQTIHGWVLFSHISSHLLMNLFFGIGIALSRYSTTNQVQTLCIMTAVTVHFFYLTTVFWLTVVNVDLWWTFRKMRVVSQRAGQLRRFMAYVTFAVGGPVIIVLLGVILDGKFGSHLGADSDCDVITPNYGMEGCYVGTSAQGVYLYFIMGILLFVNFILLIVLLRTLRDHKRSTSASLGDKGDIISTELLAKLFIVMGSSWCLEFIFWCIEAKNAKYGPSLFWLMADVVNFFVRPILIFYFLGWKKLKTRLTPVRHRTAEADTPLTSDVNTVKTGSSH